MTVSVNLSPVFNQTTFLKNDGTPATGYKLFAYEAGSFSVLKDTYTSEAGDTLNENPLVLNSVGQLDEVAIWLISGETYNMVYTQDDGTTVIKNFDDIAGVLTSTGGGGSGVSVWNSTSNAAYLSPGQFLVSGNYAADFAVGNRARITQDGGFAYGTVTAVTFSDPNTHVTLELDAGSVLDGTLSAADWSSLIVGGRTVDAGAVSYSPSTLTYAVSGTVGNKLRSIDASISSLQAEDVILQNQITTIDGTLVTQQAEIAALQAAPAANQPYWSYYNAALRNTNGIVNYQSSSVAAVGVTSYTAGVMVVGTTGIYQVDATFTAGYDGTASDATFYIRLYKNGSSLGPLNYWTEANNTVERATTSISVLVSLTAGDSLGVHFTTANNAHVYAGSGSFSGFKVA